MKIQCTHCDAKLTGPDSAVGRMVRCPECQTKFRLDGPASDLNETISGWLLEDVANARQLDVTIKSHLNRLGGTAGAAGPTGTT